jgi:5'-methylthioadenosine phosphorylase
MSQLQAITFSRDRSERFARRQRRPARGPAGPRPNVRAGEAHAQGHAGQSVEVDTPFGPPSSPLLHTQVDGVEVYFLGRHGPGHRFSPSAVPYRANIFALKKVGVTTILASGAVGSLREQIEPGHLVLCDQIIDKTYRRAGTFFEGAGPLLEHPHGHGVTAVSEPPTPVEGELRNRDVSSVVSHPGVAAGVLMGSAERIAWAVHVEFADPFCRRTRKVLEALSAGMPTQVHAAGTYVCMEGPQFSTRAESHVHRAWGGDVIGMTCCPEAKLAREAEMCYALIALPTDYDCWRTSGQEPDRHALLSEIVNNLNRATGNAVALVRAAIPRLAESAAQAAECPCRHALELAIWSDRARITAALGRRLEPILSRSGPRTRPADKP